MSEGGYAASSASSTQSSTESWSYPEEAYGLCEKKPMRLKPAGYVAVLAGVLLFIAGLVHEFSAKPVPIPSPSKVETIEFSIKGLPIKLERVTK